MQQNTHSPSLAAQIAVMTGPVPLSFDVLSQVVGGGPVGNWYVKSTAMVTETTSSLSGGKGPVGNW